MTNPVQALRMLITYAVCIPLAILMGYLMTEVGSRPDYSNLFIVGIVMAVLVSPIFIKWYYPIMIFGLSCPMYCFFLKGNPPLMQVVVIIGLMLAVIERTLSAGRRFISAPAMAWALVFTAAMVILTAELTGGIGLHTLGGDVGGGKKYIQVFAGIAMFFALVSHRIPKEKRWLYVGLFWLSGVPAFVSDLFPVLPEPFSYINLLFPPTHMHNNNSADDFVVGVTRLGSVAGSAGCVANFMMARYGLRGIFAGQHPVRFATFALMILLTLLGGFRIVLITYVEIIFLLFFLEGLHRTRLVLAFFLGGILVASVLAISADKLPFTFQRSMSFLPLHWDSAAVMDAEVSKRWREEIWADTWPKVPDYLLLGKGYALHQEEFNRMGGGVFESLGEGLDRSQDGLAISMDYHNGPLSTLMPFGLWGMISYVWVALAGIYILYRNWRHGDLELKTVNALLMTMGLTSFFAYFFLFGDYPNDIANCAKLTGFSVALNWGVKSAPALSTAAKQVIRRLPRQPDSPRIQPA